VSLPPLPTPPADAPRQPVVGLFVSCLVDTLRPAVAEAAVQALRAAGCRVRIPPTQTCCGQPQWNGGEPAAARTLALQFIETFTDVDFVVVPSGSCAGMVRHHYPQLLEGDWRVRAEALAERTWELTSFLHDVMRWAPASDPNGPGEAATYHDACAGLRELGVQGQPRALLASRNNARWRELSRSEVCCGFGGTFCVKLPAISARMADKKLDDAIATGATLVVGADLGCLLALAGRAQRRELPLTFRHVAELLVDTAVPPIGAATQRK
jgi:L-lactate dehydrogenase complex protein LldE